MCVCVCVCVCVFDSMVSKMSPLEVTIIKANAPDFEERSSTICNGYVNTEITDKKDAYKF